ncbi:hypothetical protein Taro_007122 [Colocasia esculenta]|uniref:Choline transporter-like protein n=1 Tax=Colocasia esculenta TaxID=4460 RepID=A0A843TU71_COLES|nr:hypothetical protein [Colocasia esculenta]
MEGAEMGRRAGGADTQGRAGAAETEAAESGRAGDDGGGGSRRPHEEQSPPPPSMASTSNATIIQVASVESSGDIKNLRASICTAVFLFSAAVMPLASSHLHCGDKTGKSPLCPGGFSSSSSLLLLSSAMLSFAFLCKGGASPFAQQKPGPGGFSVNVWKYFFLAHLVVMLVLITVLAVRGLRNKRRSFHPAHWFLPLFTAVACSVPTSAAWLLAALFRPSAALRASLWLAPLMTFAVSILLFDTGTAVGLAFAVLGLVLALVQSLYACWVTPRLEYATEILAASLSATQGVSGTITLYVALTLAAGLAWSGVWVLGVGGVAANGPRFSGLYIVTLLLAMAWTLHVLKNIVTVAVAGFAYIRLGRGGNMDPGEAWRNAWTISLGSICLGSAVVPVVVTVRDTARSMNLAAGGADEFLFSCADCYMGFADWLITHANRWAFVQVGVYNKGFVTASEDTWKLFMSLDMEPVIDADLTSSFCFLSAVAGGAFSALLSGIWVLVVDKSYGTAVSLYAFVLCYFLIRIAMAWPQACVSALHLAYAENPQIPQQFGGPITNRIRTLQRT